MVMAVPPHGMLNTTGPSRTGDTALMFAARVGDLTSAQLLVAAGANVNDADAWGVSATDARGSFGFRRRGPVPAGNAAPIRMPRRRGLRRYMPRSCGVTSRWWRRCWPTAPKPTLPLRTWTPTRRSSAHFNFPPEHVGATPFWLAARFANPALMRLLLKHGADPLVVHRADYHAGEPATPRSQITTALMAALGMGGGSGLGRARPRQARSR